MEEKERAKVDLAVGAELERPVCFANPDLEGPAWEEITEALTDPEVGLCAHSARFTHADVVEHICALSSGRLDLDQITAMADRFLVSDLAVRLTPGDQPASSARRRSGRPPRTGPPRTAPWPWRTPWLPRPSPRLAPPR